MRRPARNSPSRSFYELAAAHSLGALLVALGCGGLAAADPSAPSPQDRIIHLFDFDERDDGNLEPIPKFWLPFQDHTFPRFATGAFDQTIGHAAPPSFRLESQGRNVAFRYTGSDTLVQPHSDYLIVGWILTDHLGTARASLSAYYLDRDRLPIASTQRFSELVNDQTQEQGWHRVQVFLPGGPPRSKFIGLTVWVVQEQIWRTEPRTKRYIEQYDVRATAWFDDIIIHRLPRVTLATSAPGGVFHPRGDKTLLVSVADADELSATLDVYDVEGQTILTMPVPVHRGQSVQPSEINLDTVGNGLYRARVSVRAGNDVLAERELVFANVGLTSDPSPSITRSFGVVLDAQDRADPSTELELLSLLKVGMVKIPVWSGSAHLPDLVDASEAMDVLLYELLKARVALTGVFAGPPSELARSAGAYPRSLLAMLADDPDAWREYLVGVVAPYSSVFRSWQVGRDDDRSILSDPRLPQVIQKARTEMEDLTTAPHLTSPGSLSWEPGTAPTGADDLCLTLDNSILPRFIKSHIDEYRSSGQPVASIYIQPPPHQGIDRFGRLRDWCKRLIWTRHAGIKTVFVPQPWHTRTAVDVTVTEPTAEFIILHAVINLLGDALPGDPVYIAPGVTALTFHDDERTVLVMWDDRGGPDGRTHHIQLGSAARWVDMWGRSSPLQRTEDGRQRIILTSQPIFVDGVDRWLMMFRTLMVLTPDLIEFSIEKHKIDLQMVNPHTLPIQGHVRIVPPRGWEIRPRQFSFNLAPGEQILQRLEVRFDRGATAGPKDVNVHIDLLTDKDYKLVVPLTLTLGIEDIDAWGLAFLVGDRLILRHGITNRSQETLNFRSFAIAPGRLRQYRILNEFQPGKTSTLEYHFENAESLRGRPLRLHLRELNGPRIHNLEVMVE